VGSGYPQEAFWRIGSEESAYVPKREMQGWSWRRLPRTTGGWVLWGSAVFLLLALVGAAAYSVRYYLLHDDRFVVTTSSDIQISGNEHLTRAQVLSVFGADLERNIFKVPLAERRADLERLPWVQHATVMRLLPHEIRVSIIERTPVAFVRQGTQIGLVDAAGVLLDMPEQSAGDPKYSFPVLTGLNAGDPLSTRAARMEIYRRFMAELDAGSPVHGEKLTQALSEVDVSNPEDVKAVIAADGADVLVHFGDEDFLTRYKSFQQHLPEWLQQYPKLASADMRYADQIVLEMKPGAAAPLAGDAPAITAPAPAPVPAAPAAKKAAATTKAPAAKTPAKSTAPAKPATSAKAATTKAPATKAKTPAPAKPAPVAAKAPVTAQPVVPKPVAANAKPSAGIKPAAARPGNTAGGLQ
jgi:cell division protein FtsQ